VIKVLLVDDESHVLEAWKALLEASGACEVRVASVGGEAIKAARAWGGPDVLVTDVVMEPMDGFRLREMLAAEFPAMRAVFVSGYDLSGYADRTTGAVVLGKPVTAEQLAAAIGLSPAPAPADPPTLQEPGVGATIGSYYLQEPAGSSGDVAEYIAWQQSMSRHVILHLLESAKARQPGAVESFLADARAKASVTHPYLLAVHEAGEADGHYFFTSDLVPGHSLAAYAAAGHALDDKVLLHALRTVAEVSEHFKKHGIARRAIAPSDIVLDASMRPRLANVARAAAVEIDEPGEVRSIAAALASLAAPDGPAAGAAAALAANADQGWAAALLLVAAAKPTAAPKDVGRVTARAEKSKQIVAISRQQQKKRLLVTAGLSLLLLVVGLVALFQFLGGGKRTITSRSIEIPAGEFVYQDGEKVNLPAFWIDEYEVTIADYKEFLDFLEANPGEAKNFAHPDMPEGKSHIPLDWADNNQLNRPCPATTSARCGGNNTRKRPSTLTRRSSTSIGSTPTPTRNGKAGACQPSRNGKKRRAAPTDANTPGATRKIRNAQAPAATSIRIRKKAAAPTASNAGRRSTSPRGISALTACAAWRAMFPSGPPPWPRPRTAWAATFRWCAAGIGEILSIILPAAVLFLIR
jgi:CheY-like chemotaxis protein